MNAIISSDYISGALNNNVIFHSNCGVIIFEIETKLYA